MLPFLGRSWPKILLILKLHQCLQCRYTIICLKELLFPSPITMLNWSSYTTNPAQSLARNISASTTLQALPFSRYFIPTSRNNISNKTYECSQLILSLYLPLNVIQRIKLAGNTSNKTYGHTEMKVPLTLNECEAKFRGHQKLKFYLYKTSPFQHPVCVISTSCLVL